MPHKYDYNERNIVLLESVLARLKYSVLPSDIIKWLENFNESEISIALNLLRFYEYISPDELLIRMDHLLKELFSYVKRDASILFVPYGKFGKSATLVTYPLTHLERFKKKEKKSKFVISNNLEFELSNGVDFDYIVFIDDLVGSGKTFLDYLNDKKEILKSNNYCDRLILLCPIIMEEAENKVKGRLKKLKIISETRFKFIDSPKSPLKLLPKREELVELLDNYGNNIIVGGLWSSNMPRGYQNSQTLISFYYGAPNNNFPVIWADNNWTPLFPRRSKIKMRRASDLKRDLSYFLSTFFNQGLELKAADELISNEKDGRKSESIQRRKNNYFLLSLLYLKYQYNKDPAFCNQFICNFLGMTKEELRLVYIEGKNKGYIHKQLYHLTFDGEEVVKKLINIRKKKSIRKISETNLTINNYLFLPKTFRGSS